MTETVRAREEPDAATAVPTRILRNAGWLSGARALADLASFGLFIVLSRAFGPAGIGEYAYGFAVAGFAVVFVNAGLDDYGVRQYVLQEPAERPRLLGRLLATQLALLTAVGAGLWAFLHVTGATADVVAIVTLLFAYEVLAALAQTLFIPALAEERMRGPAAAELACRLVVAVGAVALVLLADLPLPVVVAAYPAGGLLLLAIAVRSAASHVPAGGLRPEVSGIPALALAAWPFAAGLLVDQLYFRADIVLLTLIRGEGAAGLYASGLKFVEVGTMPVVFLGLAAYPALSRAHGRGRSPFVETVDHLARMAVPAGAFLAWLLYFAVPPLVTRILGAEFAQAARVTRALAAYALLLALETVLFRALFAAHEQTKRLWLLVAATAVDVGLGLALIPRWGVWGAVVSTVAAVATLDLLSLGLLRGLLSGAAGPLGALARHGLALGILAAATAGGAALFPDPWMPGAVSLAALAGWTWWITRPVRRAGLTGPGP